MKASKAIISAVGLAGLAALTSVPANAGGGCCDCYGGYGYSGYRDYGAPRVYGYTPSPSYYRYDPRWQYSAAYFNPPPPPRVYGYAYADRGPAVVIIQRDRWRDRNWYGRW